MKIIDTFFINSYKCFGSITPELQGINVSQVGWLTECGQQIGFGNQPFVEGYEPDDPLPDGTQPNNSNGWPATDCI